MRTPKSPKVFISYSWDNDDHISRVTELAQSLRKDGIECIIDNFKDHLDADEIDWETWIDKNIKSVEYVLVVCTENYKYCFDENENCIGDGGVKWEAQLLRILLKKEEIKLYTIIFNEQDKEYVPDRLSGKNRYCISEPEFDVYNELSSYHDMYRKLTKQSKIKANDIGEIVVFPSKKENLIKKLTNSEQKSKLLEDRIISNFEESENFINNDTNKHRIQINNDIYFDMEMVSIEVAGKSLNVAIYPVTFEEYDLFCKDTNRKKPNDCNWGREKRPIINVSWYDAIAYCNWLAEKSNGINYRLLTSTEWNFIANKDLPEKGYKENIVFSQNKTSKVGTKKEGQLGLYDIVGNVYEWCNNDENMEQTLYGLSFHKKVIDLEEVLNNKIEIPSDTSNCKIGFRIAYSKN